MLTGLGMLGCALMAGDGVITPAISVLSALRLLPDGMLSQSTQVFLTVLILFFLFVVQQKGSQVIGNVAGPIMVLWFLTIGLFGLCSLTLQGDVAREVLSALSPAWVIGFWTRGRFTGYLAWRALAGVVLCVT